MATKTLVVPVWGEVANYLPEERDPATDELIVTINKRVEGAQYWHEKITLDLTDAQLEEVETIIEEEGLNDEL